jgi:hypothetical protein
MELGQTIGPPLVDANIRPLAYQYYAKDFYEAYKKHKDGPKFSPARFFLISRSIELAAKSLQLADGLPAEDLNNINHDLSKACNPDILNKFGISLSTKQISELEKANDYYKNKGFEYFLYKIGNRRSSNFGSSGPQMALTGWPNLPDVDILETIVDSLISVKLPD